MCVYFCMFSSLVMISDLSIALPAVTVQSEQQKQRVGGSQRGGGQVCSISCLNKQLPPLKRS